MTSHDTGGESMIRGVTVTGTRSTGHRQLDSYRQLFNEYLKPFALPGVRFYLGGAAGIDSLALLWLASESDATLTVVVPAGLADQPADARHATATVRQSGRLDEVVELGGQIGVSGYHARNRWMVDRSDFVIGFPRGNNPSSGTLYTLGYACTLSKPRLEIPI
jgi:hypothetical protein